MLDGVFAHVRRRLDALGVDLPLEALYREEAFRGARPDVICLAPHGGGIEPWTRFLARQVHERAGCDYWSAWADFYVLLERGVPMDTTDRVCKQLHVTSHRICRHPELTRELAALVAARRRRYALAVSVHGKADDSPDGYRIEIGGVGVQREALCARLAAHGMRAHVAHHGARAGRSPLNIVNLLGRASVQIEIPRSYRRNPVYGRAIAAALAELVEAHPADGH